MGMPLTQEAGGGGGSVLTPCPKDLHGMQGIKDGLSISLSHIPSFQSILVK